MADEVHAAWLEDHRDQSNGALADRLIARAPAAPDESRYPLWPGKFLQQCLPARDRRDTVETTKAPDSTDLKPCRVMILAQSVTSAGPLARQQPREEQTVKVPILAILERSAGLARRALLALLCLLPLLGLAHEVKAGGDGSEGTQPTGSRARP